MTDEAVFVGRERELAELLELADHIPLAHGQLALIQGEPGIGKTALAEQAVSACAERGFAVHWGTCWEDDEQPPFWVWIQVLRTVLPGLPLDVVEKELGPGYRHLGLLVPEFVPPPSRGDAGAADEHAQFVLYDIVARTLMLAGRTQPQLVILDDLHVADRSSLRCLAFLARQLRELHLMIIGTHRDVDVAPDSPWTAAAADLARMARPIELGGLSLDETASLLDQTLVARGNSRLAAEVLLDSGGNPLFARQVARLFVAEGRVTRVPGGVREVLLRRVHRLPDATCRVLEAAAVMGTTVEVPELALVCELAPDAVLDLLTAPIAARILREDPEVVGRLSFAHVLMRQVILEQLPSSRRTLLHRRAAEALESVGLADPGPYLARLAGHYVEAAALGESQPAIRYSRAAAAQAINSYAYEDALRHLTNARRLLEHEPRTPPERLAELALDVADVQLRAEGSQAAAATYRQALEIADRAQLAHLFAKAALGCCVEGATGYEERPDLIALLKAALDRLPHDDQGLRSAVLAELADLLAVFDDGFEQASDAAHRAVDSARASGDELALSRALLALLHVEWSPSTLDKREAIVAELDEIARKSHDADLEMHARLNAFSCRIEAGDRDAADDLLGAIVDSTARLRTPRWTGRGLTSQAAIAVLQGDYSDARRLIDELAGLVERAPTSEGPLLVLHARAQMCFDVLLDETEDMADKFLRLASEHRHSIWSVAALLLTLVGREDEARRPLWLGVDVVSSYPNRRALLTSAVRLSEVAVRLDDEGASRILYGVLSPYAERVAVVGDGVAVLGPVALELGKLAMHLGDLEAAERHLSLSDEISRRMRARPWTARTLLARAGLALLTCGADCAAPLLNEARKLAEELQLTRLIAEIDAMSKTTSGMGSHDGPLRAALAWQGNRWTVVCGGVTTRLKDSKGMRYLAELINHPNVERHVIDLVTMVEGVGEPGIDRRSLGDAGPLLDSQAKAAYRRRLTELRERLETAESMGADDAAEQAQAEIDALAAELARAVGLGGRDRRAASVAEKARLNVTRAMRAAITRIAEAHPALGEHLDTAVRTGTFCAYEPARARAVVWESTPAAAERGAPAL